MAQQMQMQIRTAEYQDGVSPADWIAVSLGDIFKLASGKSRPESFSEFANDECEHPIYGGNGILGYTDRFILQDSSIVIGRVGEYCGSVHICEPQSWISDNAMYITAVQRDDISFDFLAYLLQWKNLNSFKKKSGQPLITQNIVYQVGVFLPPLDEQRRIAAALSAIQRAIAAQDDVIAAAKELKRSLIHRLFTCGPGPVPAETKETEIGEISVHWDVMELGRVVEIKSGGTPSREEPTYWNGSIPWVKTGEINYKDIMSTEEYITLSGLENSSAKVIPSGTVLMAMYGQGVTRGRVAVLGIDATINQACAAFFSTALDSRFLFHMFTHGYERIRDYGHGAHQKNLSATLLKTITVPVPPMSEQMLISNQLSVIDAKIAAEEDRKIALQALFRSALHSLMTGQIRLLEDNQSPIPM